MILQYGSYNFDDAAVSLNIAQAVVRNDKTGQRRGVTKRWTITGELQGATVAALTTEIQSLESAFSSDGNDLILYASDGTTQTAHRVLNSEVQGGLKVVSLDYPTGDGAEYATFRSFRIVVEGFIPISQPGVVDYSENLQRIGTGGPIWKFLLARTGPPQRQQLHQISTQRLIQTGRAVGYSAYPVANAPLFPSLEHQEQRLISLQAPIADNGTLINYGVTWGYTMEGSGLTGNPSPFT